MKLVETMGFTDEDRYEVKSLSFACCHICNGHHRMGDFDFQSQSGFVRHFRYEILKKSIKKYVKKYMLCIKKFKQYFFSDMAL